jgi:hypothetical protein
MPRTSVWCSGTGVIARVDGKVNVRMSASPREERHAGTCSARIGALAALVGLAVMGVAACGAATGTPYQPPADWHEVTPPTGEQRTSSSYAISPDVPGLIVACIGDRTFHSIWRTRDAGAHWQMLPTRHLDGGCAVALPAGGHGTVFVDSGSPEFISVSHDAGATWQTLATSADYPTNATAYSPTLPAVFALLSVGVYRDGQLYSLGAITRGQAGRALPGSFFASTDDGRTWQTLDASADPLAPQGFFATGLTPDYRTPDAWYRLMAQAGLGGSSNAQGGAGSTSSDLPATVLEHSSDTGRTWTALGPIGPRGALVYALAGSAAIIGQSLVASWWNSAMLVTTPGQPNSLCAGFYADVGPNSGALDDPHNVAVYGSDDGGATWHGATVAQTGSDGYARDAQPVVAMDAHGDCYTAATATPADAMMGEKEPDRTSTTFWRLAPEASASPQQIAHITRLGITTLGVTVLPGQSVPRLLAVVYSIQPQPGPLDHLIWLATPDS